MLESVISLASYGFSAGGAVGNLLYTLENNGVFAYVLPFIFIFAVLFVILQTIPIFGKQNKGINAVLAIVIGLMALQLNFVSYFFQEIFPRMGVVLGILIVAMILVGLFFDYDSDAKVKKVFGVIVGLALVVIVVQALTDSFGWSGLGSGWGVSYFLRMYGWGIFGGILFVGAIVAVIVSGGNNNSGQSPKK
jgi:hypothetical protein